MGSGLSGGSQQTHGLDPIFGKAVEDALRAIEPSCELLQVRRQLERRLGSDLALRASQLWNLRERARRRGLDPALRWLTPAGLEQLSAPLVAADRAQQLHAAAPAARVADLTCGIGGDSLALARQGSLAAGCDRDEWSLRCARANLREAGLDSSWVRASAERPGVLADSCVIDPDRRPDGARTLDPERWSPSFDDALATAARFEGACLKLAPALDPSSVDTRGLATRWSWVGAGGELAELALWTGALAGDGEATREARVLTDEGAHALRGPVDPQLAPVLDPAAAHSIAAIVEPHPALIRSGLLDALAAELDLAALGPNIAFLGGANCTPTPFGRAYRVLAECSADPKRVRAMLTANDVGEVTVKKRGHPDAAEVLARRYRGKGAGRGHVLVARLQRGHRAYLVERGDGSS